MSLTPEKGVYQPNHKKRGGGGGTKAVEARPSSRAKQGARGRKLPVGEAIRTYVVLVAGVAGAWSSKSARAVTDSY